MTTFTMPSLGADMEDGTLVEWLVSVGDEVSRGDIIAVVETQKGAIEIEVFQNGTIDEILATPGTTLPVGAPLALISEAGAAPERPAVEVPAAQPEAVAGVVAEPQPEAVAEAAPAAPAAPEPAPPAAAAPLAAGTRAKASPAARRLAAELGIDLAELSGTGPEGAITSRDLPLEKRARPAERGYDFSEMRKAIGAAMARANREIPHYYLSHTISLGKAAAWLETTNAALAPPERLLMGALFVKAAALAVRQQEGFNGFFVDETFRPSETVHPGVAIFIRGGGLVAPAIHDADGLSLSGIMAALRDVTARARQGKLRSSELTDPTFTISSLGERGVETLYGLINPPQVALVGFGRVSDRPWARDGDVTVEPVLTVTLSADHRVTDGRQGARLLNTIGDLLEAPEEL